MPGVRADGLRGGLVLPLLLAGVFFVVFYTWPLKYLGLGEPAVLAADSEEAVRLATTMVGAPVKLTWGDKVWTLAAEDLAAYTLPQAAEAGCRSAPWSRSGRSRRAA